MVRWAVLLYFHTRPATSAAEPFRIAEDALPPDSRCPGPARLGGGQPPGPSVTLKGMKQCDSRLGFTLLEALVSIAIVALVAAFLWPTLYWTTGCGHVVQCQSHLKQVYTYSVLYSNKVGGGLYPLAPGNAPRAHESFQILVDFMPDIDPKLFTCPAGDAVPALRDSKSDKLVLTSENVDYAWTAKPVSNQSPAAVLCSDKYADGHADAGGIHSGHKGNLNVLRSDGSVSFVVVSDAMITEDKLPKGLVR